MTPTVLLALLIGATVLTCPVAVLLASREFRKQRSLRSRILGDLQHGLTSDAEGGLAETTRHLSLLARLGDRVSFGSFSRTLQTSLLGAGLYNPNGPAIFLGTKLALGLLGLGLSGLSVIVVRPEGTLQHLAFLTIPVALFFAPNLYLMTLRSTRMQRIRKHLPGAIDLVEVCVSSGMSLDSAWDSVANEVRSVDTVLADEMRLTTLESSLGVARVDAMRTMAERTGVPELSTLVTLLIQSDRFGSSLSQALKEFATTLREEHAVSAETAAQKMAVKLLFPMIVFIFPALLLIVMGPAFLSVIGTL